MKKHITALISMLLSCTVFTSSFAYASDTFSTNTHHNNIKVISLGENSERIITDYSITDDIFYDTGRTITTTTNDGTTVFNEDYGSGLATLSVNGKIVETYDMNQLREEITTWVIPEEDAAILQEYYSNVTNDPNTLPNNLQDDYTVSITNGAIVVQHVEDGTSTLASSVTCKSYEEVTVAHPPYMYKTVDTKTVFSSVCAHTLNMKVKDSMYSYIQSNSNHRLFNAGTALSVIAGTFMLPISIVQNSLTGYFTLVNNIMKLSTAVDYYFSEDYTYYALRQGYVYDYITSNQDVSVKTEYGTGRLSITWDMLNGEYVNYEWKHTAQASPFVVSFDTILNDTQTIWENNIEEYGYWPWGDI